MLKLSSIVLAGGRIDWRDYRLAGQLWWEAAKVIIRKHTATMALKADLVEHRQRGSGHMVNSISGSPRSPSQSPGQQRKKYNNENQGRNRAPQAKGRDPSQGKRNSRKSSNTRLYYNCVEIKKKPYCGHFPQTKERRRKDWRKITNPIPKERRLIKRQRWSQSGRWHI